MLKKITSLCFSVLFVLFITAPTLVLLVDDSIDVSVVYSTSEEEENKGSEKRLNVEVFITKDINSEAFFDANESKGNLGYTFKNYSKPHLNIISPPPDFI